MADIFRAYDVRGIYPDEINPQVALKVANAAARFLKAKRIIVACDVRDSSQDLLHAVLEGATLAGADVVDIGQATTPLFYYAVKELGVDGGIMVTASHNPKEYNGLKIVGPGAQPIGLTEGLAEIKALYSEPVTEADTTGMVHEGDDLKGKYMDFLVSRVNFKKELKIAIDAGNGAASLILNSLLEQLNVKTEKLFFNLDGTFPGRGPNPAIPGALDELKKKVIEVRADIGFAFDSDADRVVMVNERGESISSQFILALLWEHNGRGRVVYDLRFSRAVKELFGDSGIKSRVGRSFISKVMAEEKADIGGETSGHFFFKEMNFVESSILAMIFVLNLLSSQDKKISELVAPLQKYAYSGEINIETDKGLEIIAELEKKYSDGRIDTLDGLTVECDDWWFNIRPSNTEPLIRLVVEAKDDKLMKEKVKEIKSLFS